MFKSLIQLQVIVLSSLIKSSLILPAVKYDCISLLVSRSLLGPPLRSSSAFLCIHCSPPLFSPFFFSGSFPVARVVAAVLTDQCIAYRADYCSTIPQSWTFMVLRRALVSGPITALAAASPWRKFTIFGRRASGPFGGRKEGPQRRMGSVTPLRERGTIIGP